MSALSFEDKDPYEDYPFKSFSDFEQLAGTISKNIYKDPIIYGQQIEGALGASKKEAMKIVKECNQEEASLDMILKYADKEDVVHDHLIAASDKKVAQLEVELGAEKTKGRYLRQRKLMSTGKIRAFAHVAKKGLRNIQDALYADQEDIVELENKKKKWGADIKAEQAHMFNGGEEAVELVLILMKGGMEE